MGSRLSHVLCSLHVHTNSRHPLFSGHIQSSATMDGGVGTATEDFVWYVPLGVRGVAPLVDHLKATVFTNKEGVQGHQVVVWDAREPLEAVSCQKTFNLGQWWRSHRTAVLASFADMDVEASALRPSIKAIETNATWKEAMRTDASFCRREWTLTTQALLAILLHFSVRARQRDAQKHATEVLQLVFTAFFSSETASSPDSVFAIEPDSRALELPCSLGVDRVGHECPCIAKVRLHCLQAHHTQGLQQLAMKLRIFLDMLHDCPKARSWFADSIDHLSAMIDTILLSREIGQATPENLQAIRGTKRRRLDTKMHDLVHEAMQRKRARTGTAMARLSIVDMHEKSNVIGEHLWLAGYLDNIRALAKETNHLSLSMDASQLGGESTMMFAAYFKAQNVGCWLPPQVLVSSVHHAFYKYKKREMNS